MGAEAPTVGFGNAPVGSSTVLSICQVDVELPTTATQMFIGPAQCQLVCFHGVLPDDVSTRYIGCIAFPAVISAKALRVSVR